MKTITVIHWSTESGDQGVHFTDQISKTDVLQLPILEYAKKRWPEEFENPQNPLWYCDDATQFQAEEVPRDLQ